MGFGCTEFVDQRQNWLRAVEAARSGISLSLTFDKRSEEVQLDEEIRIEYKKTDTDVPENLKYLLQ